MLKKTAVYFKETFRIFLASLGYKKETMAWKMIYIKIFFDYARHADVRETTKKDLLDFFAHLNRLKTVRGTPYSKRTREMIMSTVRLYFRCLYSLDKILANPARGLSFKMSGKENTRAVMTKKQIETIMALLMPLMIHST